MNYQRNLYVEHVKRITEECDIAETKPDIDL